MFFLDLNPLLCSAIESASKAILFDCFTTLSRAVLRKEQNVSKKEDSWLSQKVTINISTTASLSNNSAASGTNHSFCRSLTQTMGLTVPATGSNHSCSEADAAASGGTQKVS